MGWSPVWIGDSDLGRRGRHKCGCRAGSPAPYSSPSLVWDGDVTADGEQQADQQWLAPRPRELPGTVARNVYAVARTASVRRPSVAVVLAALVAAAANIGGTS